MNSIYRIDDYAEFEFSTQDPVTSAVMDATGLPTYRIYEENNDTAVATGNCAKRDDANTTGYYYARARCTVAAGFEVGKTYNVRVSATVNTVAGAANIGRFTVVSDNVWNALVGGTANLSVDLVSILGTAITGTAAYISAAFTKFFNKATPTGTINSLPDAVPGAADGLPTTNGVKVNQTVDLTPGQALDIYEATASEHVTPGTFGKLFNDLVNLSPTSSTGVGVTEFTFTYLNLDGVGVPDALVVLWDNAGHTGEPLWGMTNSAGIVLFNLDLGATYYYRLSLDDVLESEGSFTVTV